MAPSVLLFGRSLKTRFPASSDSPSIENVDKEVRKKGSGYQTRVCGGSKTGKICIKAFLGSQALQDN